MKIRFLVSIGGSTGVYGPGDEADWEDNKDAKRLIEAGFAEAVTPSKKPTKKTATAPAAAETAATE
jgi:hypothetical protein